MKKSILVSLFALVTLTGWALADRMLNTYF